MKNASVTLLILVIVLYFVKSSVANEGMLFKKADLKGYGCPAGTGNTTITPDGKTMSILFDAFSVEVPQLNGMNDNDDPETGFETLQKHDPRLDRKNCEMSIVTTIPAGQKVVSIDATFDYRGFTSANKGVETGFRSVFLEKRGLGINPIEINKKDLLVNRIWKGINPSLDDDFYLTETRTIRVNSTCSNKNNRTFSFRVKNSMYARISDLATRDNRFGVLSLDSIDMTTERNEIKYTLKLERCK